MSICANRTWAKTEKCLPIPRHKLGYLMQEGYLVSCLVHSATSKSGCWRAVQS